MSKRGQNEGSIFKRADGRWCATLSLGRDEHGKRQRRYFYGDTRRGVQEQLTKALRDQQQGLPVAPAKQTTGQFLHSWLEGSRPSMRPSTFGAYESDIRLHLVPALGTIPLQKLSPQDVQKLIATKLSKGLEPSTVQHIRAVLRRALAQAVKWGLVPRNVAALVDPPHGEAIEQTPLTATEARALLEALKGDRLLAMYSVALALGLRRGEVCALKWQDVDLKAGTLYVRATLQRVGGKLQLLEPKTEKSKRTIKLPSQLKSELRAHRDRMEGERDLAGDRWKENGFVFPTSIGTPYEPRNLNRHFTKLLARLGMPHSRVHDMRHTAASLLLAQGVSLRLVSEILGHSSTRVTGDIYGHPYDEARDSAASRIGDLLWGETGTV